MLRHGLTFALALGALTACRSRASHLPVEASLACAADPAATSVRGRVSLRVLVASDVDPADRTRLDDALAAWAQCVAIPVDRTDLPPLPLLPPFPTRLAELTTASEVDAQHQLTAPLSALLEQVATPGPLLVVLLTDVADPASAAAAVLPDLVGLGLPADTTVLGELPTPRASVVLLSARALRTLTPIARASAVGHELGHARGLAHDPRPCNLMYAGVVQGCGVGFVDARQAQTFRAP